MDKFMTGAGVIGVIAVLVALSILLGGYYSVDATQVALVTRGGAIVGQDGPGFHLKWPWIEGVYKMQTDIQDVAPDKGVNTYTVDNQEVDVRFNVFYRVQPDKAAFVYTNVPDYRLRLFTMATDRLKAEVGKINVSSVAEKRGELRDAVKAVLQRDAASLGITVTDFQLTDLQYDQTYREAVAKAAVSKAGIESREYERQQAMKSAETAKVEAIGKADAARESARGAADAALLNAQANAKAIQLRGEAEAGAIKAQADALRANPDLTNLRKAERWDGKLPVNMYAGAPIPFLSMDATQHAGQ